MKPPETASYHDNQETKNRNYRDNPRDYRMYSQYHLSDHADIAVKPPKSLLPVLRE